MLFGKDLYFEDYPENYHSMESWTGFLQLPVTESATSHIQPRACSTLVNMST